MKKQLLTRSLLLVALFFSGSTLLAQTQVCGTVNLELYDSYGDGWNGNEIDVKFTGGDSTYTLSSGSFISIPLSVNYLDTAQFAWQAGGSYTSECTYKITDASGTVLYSSPTGNNMTAGSTQYTAYCATAPVPQVCGTVTLELYDSYGDGWNGNDMDVVTSSGTTTYGMSSGSFISYTLTIAYQDTAHFIWQAGGSYTSECTYKIKDAYGTTLYSSPAGNLMTAGATQYSAQCNSLASCIAPTNLSVTTGAYDAAVSWDAGASAYAYHLVEYDTAGFTPGTGDTMWVYSDTAYITGLDPATSYDFFVTTLCSATDSSAATAALAQFTQCAAIATPWSENFDNTTTGSAFNPSLPQCWDFYTSAPGTFWYPYIYNRNYSFYANSGTNFLYAYRSSSTSTATQYADTTMVIMPEIQGLDSATKQLKFYARTTSVGRPGEVMIGFTDAAGTPSSLRIVDTVYAPSTSYSEFTIYLDNAISGDARVAFFLRHNSTFDYICIDDVSVTDIPPCPEPIALSLTGSTQTTGTISWSSSSSAFNIEVGPMGFTQGTGTSYSGTTTSYTATGLTQNTYYDAYVMSNCTSTGDGTSNWVGPFTFKTECGDQAVPYSTGFEGYTDGSSSNPDLPDCWAYAKTGTSSSFYAYNWDYSFYANTGINAVRFYGYVSTTSTNSSDGDTLAVYSPRILGLGFNDKQLLFSGRGGSTSASYVNQIIIATADTNASLGSLHIVDTVVFTGTTYGDYTIDLDNIPITASRVVFLMIPEFPSGYTYGYNYAYIDDVEIRDNPNAPNIVLDTTICPGDSITLSTGYTLSTSNLWNTGETSQSITVVADGIYANYYLETLTDSIRYERFIIRTHASPQAVLSITDSAYKCQEDSISLSAIGTNGSYVWNNSTTNNAINIQVEGDYWYTVTDSNSCSSVSDTLTVMHYNPNPVELVWSNADSIIGASIVLTNKDTIEACYGDNIDLTIADTTLNSIWNNGDTNMVVAISQSGYYYATTTSSNGCVGHTDTIFVQIKAELQDSILSPLFVQNCPSDSVTLSTGNDINQSYSWSTGEVSSEISVLANGQYFATVTNDFGCSNTSDTVIIVNHEPNDSIWAASSTTFCVGDSVKLMVAPNDSYVWNNTDSSQDISVKTAGTYWASITDSNGCVAFTDTILVTTNSLPVESIVNTGSLMFCNSDSTILSLSGNNNYLWSNGDSTNQVSILNSGDYFASIIDSNGCQSYSDTVAITVNALPSDSLVITGNTEFCQGDSVIVAALTNVSYIWNTGDTTQEVVVSSTSAITGMVTDANGCTRQLDTALITVNPLPNDSIYATGPTTFCLGDSVVILSADASAMHLWNTLDTSSSIVATSSGAFYVGLVTNKGCIGASDTVDVIVNPNPNAAITVNGSLDLCPGDSVELSANQGLTYYWTTGDSTQAITVAQTGNFAVNVTNGFGCTKASTVQSVVLHPFPQTSVILGDTTGIVPLQQYTYVVTQTPGNTYNWSAINGAVVSGQGTNIASVMWGQDTVGSLQLVESNGYCTDTSSLSIRTNIGLNEYGLRNVELFPNPTQGNVFISADEPLGEIMVYAATGALVASKYTAETSVQFDFSTLSAGVYWITIGTERYRLVVMH